VRLSFLLLCTITIVPPTFGSEADILFSGANPEPWNFMREAPRLNAEFNRCTMEPGVDGSDHVVWRFNTKQISYADVFLNVNVARPFESLRLRVKNDGPAFRLSAKLREQSNAEWTPPAQQIAADGPWTTIEFKGSDFHVASWSSDSDEEFSLPSFMLAVIAFDVVPRTDYTLRIESVEIVYPDPPTIEIIDLHVPRHAKAGDLFDFELTATLQAGAVPDRKSELRFVQDGSIRFAFPLTYEEPGAWSIGERRRIKTTAKLGPYVWGGELELQLVLGETKAIVRDQGGLGTITVDARKSLKSVVAVKRWRGAPTLFVNGKPHTGMMFTAYNAATKTFREFTEAGVDLFSFAGTPSESAYGLSRTSWVAPDQFDYSQFDERVMMVLEANPHAHLFPRLYLHAPTWWCDQHPDDLVTFDPGDGKPILFLTNNKLRTPSWASDAWRRDTVYALERLIDHIESAPWADRCIGYHLSSGGTEEWFMWGSNENQWADYSPANTRKFREWLRRRYLSEKGLQRAWNDPSVSFDTATIPLKTARQAASLGILRDPAREQQSIDYYQYTSWLVADTIRYFAKAVKERTHREKIVGAFYGYVLQLMHQRMQNAGHLALQYLCDSPDIDFLCSPTSYAFRQLGGQGTSHYMSLLQSWQLHGKLWFSETDIRTSLTAAGNLGDWGKPATIAGDILQQNKEIANALANGAAQWWFDVGGIRYDDPDLMARISLLNDAAEKALTADRSPVDEIAVIVDPNSMNYVKVGEYDINNQLILQQIPQLARIGAPVGYYALDDLDRLPPRKMYVFLTALAPTARQRELVEQLKGEGRVLVFVYAQGVYRDGKWAPSAMEEFIGMQIEVQTEPTVLKVMTNGVLGAEATGLEYGLGHQTAPVPVCVDNEAEIIGQLRNGRVGLAWKQHRDWTSVFSAPPTLPAQVLRALARKAGVHLYIDSYDVVWATRGVLALSVDRPGRRTLRLPTAANVTDLYETKSVGMNLREFTVEMPALETKIWRIDSARP
jgi:hypothetical protein